MGATRRLDASALGETPDLGGYAWEMERANDAEPRLARRVHDLVHLAPGAAVAPIGRMPRARPFGRRMMRGDRTPEGPLGKPRPLAAGVGLLSDGVRTWPAPRRRAGLESLAEPPAPERFLRSRAA